MNCLACRRALLTQPSSRSDELAAHLHNCAACARLAKQQARFEQRLEAALRVPVPENLRERVRFAASMQRRRPWLRLATAAVVAVIATSLALGGWEYDTSQRLARALASQIHRVSPESVPDQQITSPQLRRLARRLGEYLAAADMGRILSARESAIRGHQAAQFLIAHGQQRARIFMLPDAWLALEHNVEAGGMPGKLIPTANGVIAVFCPDRGMLARVAEDMRRSMAQRS